MNKMNDKGRGSKNMCTRVFKNWWTSTEQVSAFKDLLASILPLLFYFFVFGVFPSVFWNTQGTKGIVHDTYTSIITPSPAKVRRRELAYRVKKKKKKQQGRAGMWVFTSSKKKKKSIPIRDTFSDPLFPLSVASSMGMYYCVRRIGGWYEYFVCYKSIFLFVLFYMREMLWGCGKKWKECSEERRIVHVKERLRDCNKKTKREKKWGTKIQNWKKKKHEK